MDERVKSMECNRCGEPVQKPFRFYRRAYHEECAIAEQRDQITQMRNKSGPYYERWLEKVSRIPECQGMATPPYIIDLYPDKSST